MLTVANLLANPSDAVVQIYADKDKTVGFATATFISKQLLISCSHLFDTNQDILLFDNKSKEMKKAKVIYRDTVKDLALIKTIDFVSDDFVEINKDKVVLDFVIYHDLRHALFFPPKQKLGFLLFEGKENYIVKTVSENGPGESGAAIISPFDKKILGIIIGVHKKDNRFLNIAKIDDKDFIERINVEKRR